MTIKELKVLLIVVLGAMFTYALLYPDLIIRANQSFLACDSRLDFVASFSLINQYFQGIIPLWAPHDQLPLSYYQIVLGRNNFFNLITSVCSSPFIYFSDHPGSFFLEFFNRFYILLLLAVRTVGCYLLLRHFCHRKSILIPSVIFLSCFFSINTLYSGVSVFNFFPLIMYLLLVAAERFRIMDLLICLLFAAIQLGTSLLCFAFVYQSLHFFILSIVGYYFPEIRNKIRDLKAEAGLSGKRWLLWGGVAFAAFLIVLPSFLLLMTTFQDITFQNLHTRSKHFFDIPYYIKSHAYFAECTFTQLINPQRLAAWFFMGFATIFMALYGLIMSPDRRKFIFLWALLMLFSVTSSTYSYQGIPGHVLNFFTNPLSFLVHSIAHQVAFSLVFFIFPLTILGIQSVIDRCDDGQVEKGGLNKKLFFVIALLLVMAGFIATEGNYRLYIIVQAVFAVVFLLGLFLKRFSRYMLFIMVAMFIFDVPFLIKHNTLDEILMPSNGHWVQTRLPLGFKSYDIQNPKITPFRQYFTEIPFKDPTSILFNPLNMPGTFLRFTNMTKNFIEVNDQSPRHKSLDFSSNPKLMGKYLMHNQRMIFEVPYAIKASDVNLQQIIANDMQNNIVMVDPAGQSLDLPDQYSYKGEPISEDAISYYMVDFLPSDCEIHIENGLVYAKTRLGLDWSSNQTSTFLTKDQQYTRIFVEKADGGRVELHPSMGKPIEPYFFDVNNYYDNGITITLPLDVFYGLKGFKLFSNMHGSMGELNVWKYNSDQTGFDYTAKYDGWLVVHYPYDKKWRVTLDGKQISFYKANTAFIAFPIHKGVNHVMIEYMPGSALRFWIAVSMVLVVIGVFFVFIYAIRSTFVR